MMNPDDPAFAPVPAPASTIAAGSGIGIRTWVLALGAGLAAGLTAWAIGEATLLPEAAFQDKKKHIHVATSTVGIHNGIISFGALGAATGLGLGLAGGLIKRSVPRAGLAGATGLLLGGGAGAALSWTILPIYYKHTLSGDLTYSLMVHGGVWVGVGAAAGLAFGVGLGGWRAALRGTLGGAGAALLATLIYEFAGGILLPLAYTDRPISQTWPSRLMARLLVSVLVAAGLALAAQPTGGRTSANEAKT